MARDDPYHFILDERGYSVRLVGVRRDKDTLE